MEEIFVIAKNFPLISVSRQGNVMCDCNIMCAVHKHVDGLSQKMEITCDNMILPVCDPKSVNLIAVNYLMVSIDVIILETFVEKPEGMNFINHKDGNKKNCSLDNLEWTVDVGQKVTKACVANKDCATMIIPSDFDPDFEQYLINNSEKYNWYFTCYVKT